MRAPTSLRITSANWKEGLIWALIGLQLVFLVPSIVKERTARARVVNWQQQSRVHYDQVRAATHLPNPELPIGERVHSVVVEDVQGAQVDLLHGRQGDHVLVFISNCAPCNGELLVGCSRLSKLGIPIRVIARTSAEQIVAAKTDYHLTVPIFSDARHPEAAENCRVVYRPTALILDAGGHVRYVQDENTGRETALKRIATYFQRKKK